MSDTETMAVYAGQYANLDDARNDYVKIEELHQAGRFGDYDAALFEKEQNGSIKVVDTDESPRAEWAVRAGLAGAVLGLLFPEFLVLAAAGGAGIGAIVGHVRGGFRRSDLKELGELLDAGEAGLVLITEKPIDESERIMERAERVLSRPTAVTPETVREAAGQTSR